MKIIILITSVCLLSLLFTSCSKEGCSDSVALNYKFEAKYDDGSCRYLAEQFKGKYIGRDSGLFFTSGDTLFIPWRTVNFEINWMSANRNKVLFTGLFQQAIVLYTKTLEINDYNFSMVDSDNSSIKKVNFSYKNDTLFYSYTSTYPDSSIHWGYGVRQ